MVILYLFSIHNRPLTRKDVIRQRIGRYIPESTNVSYTIFKVSFPVFNEKKNCTLIRTFSQNIIFRNNFSCLRLEATMEVGNTALRNQAVKDTEKEDGELVKTRTTMVVDKLK